MLAAYGGRLMTKKINNENSGEFVLPHLSFFCNWHKFTWIVIIKFFANYLSPQPILGCQLGFHDFSPYIGAAPFLQL